MEIINSKPLVGVSQCLLGEAVRYDGKSKTNKIVVEQFSQLFQLIPVCPEVEAGLSIPRPPVQLTGSIKNPNLTGRDEHSIDVTNIMQRYCETKPAQLKTLSGFICKSRSPSCGLNSAPIYIDGHCVTESGRGIFAQKLCETFPNLAVIEDTELDEKNQLQHFIQTVLKHHTCL